MGLKTVLYIPYKDFKEKLKLTRKYKKEGYYVEDWGDGIYCCLLYTSPSPRDKRQSRMPSSA